MPGLDHHHLGKPHHLGPIQGLNQGLSKSLHAVDKSLHTVADGAAALVTTLAGSTLDEEQRELSKAYKEAQDELKHETDWHKGELTLDQVQGRYHAPKEEPEVPPQHDNLKPINPVLAELPIPDESLPFTSPSLEDALPTQSSPANPPVPTSSPPATNQKPDFSLRTVGSSSTAQQELKPKVPLLGGPPVPSDSVPFTTQDSSVASEQELKPKEPLYGGPPVPASSEPYAAAMQHTTSRDSSTLSSGIPSAQQETILRSNPANIAPDIAAAWPSAANQRQRASTDADAALQQSLATSTALPDVSALTIGVGPTADTAKAALHLPGGGHHATLEGEAATEAAGEPVHHDVVSAESQVPVQQSLADVADAPVAPIGGPGPALTGLRHVVEVVTHALPLPHGHHHNTHKEEQEHGHTRSRL